jgi:hypothetical protein
MDTDPQYERLPTRPNADKAKLTKATKNRIESLLKQGTPSESVARLTAVAPVEVAQIRNQLQDSGQLDILAFKRKTAMRLASFIDKSTTRLEAEVDSIPIGQLMLSTAIAIDKMDKLVDPTPTVHVKAELKISADDINKLLNINSIPIDVTPPPEAKS